MRKITLSEIFNKRIVCVALALVMALSMLTFAACKDDEPTSSNNSSVTSSQNESDNSSDVNSDDSSQVESEDSSEVESPDNTVSDTPADTSSDKKPTTSDTSNKKPVNPLKGDIYVGYDYDSSLSRTDLYEIKPVADPSNLAFNYVGYAEEERIKLRDEILNSKNTLDIYDIKGKVYYVSTSGDDDNDGKTPKTAKQTLAGVSDLVLEEGDAVLFERGCIFRIYEPFYCQSGITYGSYGKGSKPMFYGSPKNFSSVVWKPTKKRNVWTTSYLYAYASGAFFDQGKEIGYMKSSIGDLNKNTDFFCDTENTVVYLYCDKGNPSKVWESIEFSQSGIRFELPTKVHDVTIDNIGIRYCGEGGIRGEYQNHHITITNCEIGFVGGAWHGAVRYGNGIEVWTGGWDLTWKHNWIYQTFDSAVTPQSKAGGNVVKMDNIVISENLFEFNNADIEYWEQGSENGLEPSRFKDWYMENNICRFTSLGWGTRFDDGGDRGIDGVFFGRSSDNEFINVNWKNNIIDCPGRMIYKFGMKTEEQYNGWARENNTYYIKQSMRTTTNLAHNLTLPVDGVDFHTATGEEDTIAAFAKFEPKSKVYWYK